MDVMDDSVGRESTDHKWDPYQKHCIKLVTKLSGCCIDENRKKFNFQKWGDMPNAAEFDGLECNHQYYGLRIAE